MVKYPAVKKAYFLKRENRFIAKCRLAETGEIVTVHVKNTGRGKEVLLPEAQVGLNYQPSPKRKTDYDLISVKKGRNWINIDSQVPNKLAYDGILEGQIQLPHLKGQLTLLRREFTYHHSKFDLYFETDAKERGFVEVKGLTLENQQIGAFPDAPTLRGLKHVKELTQALKEHYHCYVLFIVQFEAIKVATIHEKMQPTLQAALCEGKKDGLEILAYNCLVQRDSIQLERPVPFRLDQEFIDPIGGE